jgi:hypothetical protein
MLQELNRGVVWVGCSRVQIECSARIAVLGLAWQSLLQPAAALKNLGNARPLNVVSIFQLALSIEQPK